MGSLWVGTLWGRWELNREKFNQNAQNHPPPPIFFQVGRVQRPKTDEKERPLTSQIRKGKYL